ncbi:MAG: phosphate ABC transporter permease PstA [Chthoniobacterales bacterium]
MRRVSNFLFPALCGLCTLLACTVFLGLVFVIAQRGLPALSWTFITEQIRQVGAEGGIFYNLVGTLILITAALLVSAPIAVGLALTHAVYLRSGAAKWRLGLFLYTLNGIPSIVFGIFGLIVFVNYFGWGKSWLTGGILLAIMILPTVTVALIERIKALPPKYVEAATGLGLRRSQVIWSVILPQSWGGLVTGSLLGLARAAGETAPIMFTATIFAGATLPHGIRESPVLSLPYHIFILAQDSFDPAVGAKLWGSALVLLALVFALSIVALPFRLRLHDEAHG